MSAEPPESPGPRAPRAPTTRRRRCSDGWECGDAAHLGEQVGLRVVAHRLVWVSPHRGEAGDEPGQTAIRAVLPHVDDLVAGQSLATYAKLVEVDARA